MANDWSNFGFNPYFIRSIHNPVSNYRHTVSSVPNTPTVSVSSFESASSSGQRIVDEFIARIEESRASSPENPQNYPTLNPNEVNATIPDSSLEGGKVKELEVDKLIAGTITSESIVLAVKEGEGDVEIRAGIATGDFNNTEARSGFIWGIDDSDNDVAKFFVGNNTNYVKWDGNTLTISGSVTATSGTIGGWTINSTSITDAAGVVGMSSAVTGGDDIRFWAGDTTPASAEFRVTESGALTASSGTIGGFTITSTALTGGIIRTASSGARIVLDGTNNRIDIFDASAQRVRLDTEILTFYDTAGTLAGTIKGTLFSSNPIMDLSSNASVRISSGSDTINGVSIMRARDTAGVYKAIISADVANPIALDNSGYIELSASDIGMSGDVVPTANDTYNLGSSSLMWNDIWVQNIGTTGDLLINPSGEDVTIDANVMPQTNNARTLGTDALAWSDVYTRGIEADGSEELNIQNSLFVQTSGRHYIGNNNGVATDTDERVIIAPDFLWVCRDAANPLFLQRTTSDGDIATFIRTSTTVGTISVTTTNTAYNTSSSRKFKENITPTKKGLETLEKIQVCDYNFKIDPEKKVTQGFIAEELYEVYPAAVTPNDEKDQSWGVEYGRLTPLLVKAVQELIQRVKQLEKKLGIL